jgi:hypothetical protein
MRLMSQTWRVAFDRPYRNWCQSEDTPDSAHWYTLKPLSVRPYTIPPFGSYLR